MGYMTILIFGANGNVGKLLVAHALEQGFDVKAFVHQHNDLPEHPRLRIISGDVSNADDVSVAMEGVDAVLSVLSSWKSKRHDVLSVAMERIVPAMQKHDVSRIISLTGAEARVGGDRLSLIHRFAHAALSLISGGVLRDGEKHIELLSRSSLDWTVLRSPVMTSSNHEVYNLSDRRPLPWVRISRNAVASAMIAQLGSEHLSQQAPFIA